MFWFFKESTEDKYLRALHDADGEWRISSDLYITTVELYTQNWIFSFIKEDYFIIKNFYEKIKTIKHKKIKNTKRKISKKFFEKIYKIAEEYISHKQIEKVGGYILDEDLQKAISDTKKIIGAHSQIELLHTQIENIRKKYK